MGWPVVAENRRWRENREIDLFAKWPFSRLFARFFGHPSWKPFFLDSGLLSCGNTAVGGHTRNATKQGGSERFRVSVPLRALLACRKGLILRTRLEDNFSACYYLYGSMFEILSTLGFKGQKTLGAAEPSSFWKGHFSQCVRCARKFGARGCSWDWGNAALHVCFWAVGLQPFLVFWVVWVSLQKHCFSTENGLFWFISQRLPFVSPFRFPWFLSLLFVTLSFSSFLFFFPPSLLSCLYFSFLAFLLLFLVVFLRCCRCCFMQKQHQNITFESFLFINYFCLFFWFVFQICSYLCFFII